MATKSDNEVIFVQVHLTLGITVGHLESSAHSMYDFFPPIKILAQKFIFFTRSKAISSETKSCVCIKLYIGEYKAVQMISYPTFVIFEHISHRVLQS